MFYKKNNLSKSFTIIELLVVIAIIGLLAVIILISLGITRERGRDAKITSQMSQIPSKVAINYSIDGNYDSMCDEEDENSFSTTSGLKKIQDDIESLGKSIKCFAEGDNYCISTELNSGEYYCVKNNQRFKSLTPCSSPTEGCDIEENGMGWQKIAKSDDTGWIDRDSFATLAFDNGTGEKMWIIGGHIGTGNCHGSGNERCRDVWFSTDGYSWTNATDNASFGQRYAFPALVFKDSSDNNIEKMWTFGGRTSSPTNDIFKSLNGSIWTEVSTNDIWPARDSHTAVIFNDGSGEKIWIAGGWTGTGSNGFNDVYSSSDGVTWEQATSDASWSPRYHHSMIVYNGYMWIMGGESEEGNSLKDVYRSNDGINWELVTPDASFGRRKGHESIVYDGKMWIMGGHDGNSRLNDVWYSVNGINWIKSTESADWDSRYWFGSTVYNNKMWIMGGRTGASTNDGISDVWSNYDSNL